MIDQIARMRHQNVSRKTAVDRDAKMVMRGAHVLFPGAACRTSVAADPRIDRDFAAENDAVGIFAGSLDDAGNLVPKRKRQSAVFADIKAPVAAQRKIAVLHVEIRVAHPAASHPDQNLGAARRRTLGQRLAQRLPISGPGLGTKLGHAFFPAKKALFSITVLAARRTSNRRARPTKFPTEMSSAPAVGSSPDAAISSGVSTPS